MQSVVGSEHQKSQNSAQSAPCALWPVELKLTHLDWNPEATLIHFQGQYLTICELDYNILQGEIQNIPKTKAAVDIGEFCLVEDLTSARWYRGRVQNRKEEFFDVFLIDHGNVLSVNISHISSCSNDLFILPPKIVCGFLANVLLLQGCSRSVVEDYLINLIGQNVTGYIQAFLPHKVLLLEASDINSDLVRHGFGRHVDTDTFLLLVEMLTEVPLKQNIASVPDLLIEKPRAQEFSFKPSGLQGHEHILSFCGPSLTCGTRAKVRVTAAINPGLFYCQMASKETDLWEMSRKLADFFEYSTKAQNQKTPENLGLLCSVRGKDGKWYRGFVKFLPVNSQVRVLFIDYGFFESVKVENVHKLPSDIYSTPIMAFRCSLLCLSGQDEAVKTQQLSFLKAGLLGKLLDVEIQSFDDEQHLYSITVIGAEDNHVKEPELIQEIPKMKVEPVETEEMSLQSSHLYYETVIGKTLDKTLEAEEVQEDSVFVGYVEYVQNPNHFWIRTQKRNEEFEEMMSKMADHFNQVKLEEDVLLNPELGTMCCALYEEDMHFYRGVVTDTLEHGAEVFFIDFGNIEKVPHMLIKNVPETFANTPAFAFCCTLVNVVPSDEVWTSAASDFFKQAVSDKALLVHVVKMRKNKFVVDLYELGSENNQSITEFLISSEQAEYWNNISIKPVVHKSTDVSEITSCPRSEDTNGNNEQWEECDKKEERSKKETEKAQASASYKAVSIKPGRDFAVRCTYINSPSDFWCQPLDQAQDLEVLMDKVQQYYSTHSVPLKSGDSCCVAKSPQDGKWHRAFFIEKHKGHARVMLIDSGCTIQIKEHNLQAIMPEFVHLEGQAFRCSLYNAIEPADPRNSGHWSPEVFKSIKDFVLNSSSALKCKVISLLNVKNVGLCNVVDLYNAQTQQSVTNFLLEQSLARKVTISAKHLSTVFPESFVYSSHNLSPGKEEQVFITHVSSHCEVYCHLERNAENVEELEMKISEESAKMMQASSRAVVSKLCLARYYDGKWYRGLARPVQSLLHLNVFFVDYGNTNISEKTHVMFIPRDSVDLLHTPMQAVKCSLASVSKGELYADVKEWLDGAIFNKQVRAVIVGKNEDGSFDVELFDGDVNINEKVNELILSLLPKPNKVVSFDIIGTTRKPKTPKTSYTKTSVQCMNQLKRQSSSSLTSKAHRGFQVQSATNKKTQNTKNLVHVMKQHKNTKVKEENQGNTSNYVRQESSQVKEQTEHLGTNPKSKHSQLTEKTDIPQLSCLPDMKVSAGFRAKCFVSHVDSVNSFFLQLSADEPAILKMGEDLNSSALRDSLKTVTSLRINDLALAEYEEDGGLYRAAVMDYEGSSHLRVEFVDYGNSAVIGKEKIYSIPKEYLCQPRFSISCSLLDTNIYQNDRSFTDAVMEKPLLVDFVCQYGTQWKVKVAILIGAVGPPAVLEAVAESSSETEKEVEVLASSSEIEEREGSWEQNHLRKSVSKNEIESERMTADCENLTRKPPPVTLTPKVKVTCRDNERTPIRNKSDSNKTQRKSTSESSVKAKSDWADAVIPKTIQAQDTKNGAILSVLGNGNFYVRLNRARKLLAAFESYIADNLYKCEMVTEKDVKQGLKCLVQADKDSHWHRAVVQQVGPKKCQVLLVDHGISEEISSGSIRRLCSDLANIQNLAVLCKMNLPGSSEGGGVNKLWSDTLKPMIGKEVKLVFVCYSEVDQLWIVEIVTNGQFLVCQIPTSLQQNEEMIPSASGIRSETKELKLDLDTGPRQQLVFAPIDTDKAYSGFAAAVTTPFEFCVVLEDLLLVMNKVSLMLDDPGQLSPLPEAHLVPGTCCLIKLESKKKLCRAEIVHADTTALLNLVDYGHYECIPYDDFAKLKRLPEEISNLPKVTYPCILRGVKPDRVNGQWTDEAAVFFQQCLYQKNLKIFFREFVSNTHWKVDILADSIHVAKELVDAGHGSYIDVMLGLRFQEQSLCSPYSPDCEEERVPEDEASDGKADLSVESTDEADGKMPPSVGCSDVKVVCLNVVNEQRGPAGGLPDAAIPSHPASD
uniref:tudor domain-containing protein 15 n=1 Tax=Semicossyphus pulcher TaxID=241346 RepID=UPI0037E8DC4C